MYRKGRRQKVCPINKKFIPYTKQFKNLTRQVVIIIVVVVVNNNNNNNNNKAAPNTHNLAKTIIDKQNKYQELANEIWATWKQKAAQVIPIVISSTGVIPKSLSQSLTRFNLHPNTYIQLQKSAILGTCSILEIFKLQIRTPSLILLIATSRDK